MLRLLNGRGYLALLTVGLESVGHVQENEDCGGEQQHRFVKELGAVRSLPSIGGMLSVLGDEG